jgi:hypothetical protein
MFRKFTWLMVTILLVGIVCWQPQSGQLFSGTRQVELSVKVQPDAGKNSALWVRNLGNNATTLVVDNGSEPVQRSSPRSLSIAGGAAVQIDRSLQRTPRSSNELLIRSHEEIAAITGPDNLPIERSEFYYPGLVQADVGAVSPPKWVLELEERGKSGTNVLKAKMTGYAPAVRGQSEPNKRYLFGVGVALGKKNGAVEIKLVSKTGQVVQSLVLASSMPLFWQGELGKFISGAEDYPSRLEVTVLRGRTQGFLTMTDVETGEITLLTITPARPGSGSKDGDVQINTCYEGSGYFTSGVLSCPGSSYAYEVFNGPPNSCGELHIVRNGTLEVTPCWLVTDANGYARKGPWTVSTNQTGTSIYIQWPDGCITTGDDRKVDDASPPTVSIVACASNSISGSAGDTAYGSGIQPNGVTASFRQNAYPYYYWNGWGYNSPSEIFFTCTMTPSGGGYSVNWSIVPPPSANTTQVHVKACDGCPSSCASAYCDY